MKWLVLVPLLFTVEASAQQSCLTAINATNRAREELRPGLPKSVLQQWRVYLETATTGCYNDKQVSDAYYYRHLVERELGMEEASKRSLSNATDKESQALQKGLDPFLASGPRPTAGEQKPPGVVRNKWALVVGVGEFESDAFPELKWAAKDASDFASVLKGPGNFPVDNVQVLLDKNASLAEVRRGIGWLREKAGPDDLVVLYFASHGSPRDIDPNGVSYIITSDTKAKTGADLYASSLQMVDLVDDLNREIKARRVVLFLDTCFSGDALSQQPASGGSRAIRPPKVEFSAALDQIKSGVGRVVITASRHDEESWESSSLKNGHFTYHLVQLLKDQSEKPLKDIFPLLRDRVSESVQKEHGKGQHPVMHKTEQGEDIILGVPVTQAAAAAALL
jgi:hypothetical protein